MSSSKGIHKRHTFGRDADGEWFPTRLEDSGTALAVKAGAFGFQLETTLSINATAAAYAAGDLLGPLITLSGPCRAPGLGGVIQNVSVTDLAKQNASLDIVIFNQEPTSTTFTDNAALDIGDVDLLKIACVAHISDWSSFGDNSYGQDHNFNAQFKLSSTVNTIYACLVARSAATYTTNADLTLKLNISSD